MRLVITWLEVEGMFNPFDFWWCLWIVQEQLSECETQYLVSDLRELCVYVESLASAPYE